MLLRQIHLEQEEQLAKRTIAKLQRERDSGVITDDEYDDKYNAIMDSLRLRFAQVMDGASYDAWRNYHK